MFNRIIIALFFIHLLLDGYLRLEGRGTSLLNFIAFPLLFIGMGYNILQRGITLSNAVLSFLFYFIFVFLSFVLSDLVAGLGVDFMGNVISATSVFLWPSLFLYFSQQKFTLAQVESLFKVINILGILIALNCLVPFVFFIVNGAIIGEFVLAEGKIRSFGFLTDQVGFALIYFFISAVYYRKISLILLYATAIIATGTRGAILIGAIAFLLTWFYRPKSIKNSVSKIRANLVLGVVLIYLVFFTGSVNAFLNIFNIRFDSSSVEHTSIQRLGAMKSGISIFLDNPILGIGYGNFSTTVLQEKKLLNLFEAIQYGDEYQTRGFANAQNQFIDIAANGGIVCLLAVLAFLYYCIKRIRLLIRWSIIPDEFKVVLIYLICMLVFNQSALYLFNFGICAFLLMILLGIANARYNLRFTISEDLGNKNLTAYSSKESVVDQLVSN